MLVIHWPYDPATPRGPNLEIRPRPEQIAAWAAETGLPVVVSDWAEMRHEAVAAADGTRIRSVHYTSGGASIVDPGKRPRIDELQTTLVRGQEGVLTATIDREAVARYRDHRRSVGLLRDDAS